MNKGLAMCGECAGFHGPEGCNASSQGAELTREEFIAAMDGLNMRNESDKWAFGGEAVLACYDALRARADAAEKRNQLLTDHYEAKMKGSERATRLERQRDAAEAEIVRLRGVIEEAPHSFPCARIATLHLKPTEPCDCWKSRAAQPAPAKRGLLRELDEEAPRG